MNILQRKALRKLLKTRILRQGYPRGEGVPPVMQINENEGNTAEVSVQVGSLWEWAKYLFWNDPAGLLKYLLPGGCGIRFCGGAGCVVVEAQASGEEGQRI